MRAFPAASGKRPLRTRTTRLPARNQPAPRSRIRGKQQSSSRYRVPCGWALPASWGTRSDGLSLSPRRPRLGLRGSSALTAPAAAYAGSRDDRDGETRTRTGLAPAILDSARPHRPLRPRGRTAPQTWTSRTVPRWYRAAARRLRRMSLRVEPRAPVRDVQERGELAVPLARRLDPDGIHGRPWRSRLSVGGLTRSGPAPPRLRGRLHPCPA
jgi:hypothetical protein